MVYQLKKSLNLRQKRIIIQTKPLKTLNIVYLLFMFVLMEKKSLDMESSLKDLLIF